MYGKDSALYAEWCKCYDPNNIELRTIEKYCSVLGKKILDIGCGTGRFLFRILPVANRVIGVDNDCDAIDVLLQILGERYQEYEHKVEVYKSGIESLDIHKQEIDLAVFSWSFYALDEKQLRKGLLNVHSILRKNGKLVILQPVGGQFEKIMRMFFEEHEEMDEYATALERINKVAPELFVQTAKDEIFSEFVFDDLNMMCEALKMFATSEGGCKKETLPLITVEGIRSIFTPYKIGEKYHLDDIVDVFVFKKKV